MRLLDYPRMYRKPNIGAEEIRSQGLVTARAAADDGRVRVKLTRKGWVRSDARGLGIGRSGGCVACNELSLVGLELELALRAIMEYARVRSH